MARSSRSTTTVRPIFRACRRRCRKADSESLIFFAFDLLFAEGEDIRALPLGERKARLKKLLEARKGKEKQIRYVEHFESGGDAVLQSACKLELEGIVSKKLDAPYRSGRTESWTKAKSGPGTRWCWAAGKPPTANSAR